MKLNGALSESVRRITALVGAMLCCVLLSACGKRVPLEEQGCGDPEVEALAKKLVAMHFDEAMSQKDDQQRLMDQYSKQLNRQSGLDTTLNTLKSRSVDPNRVALSDVIQLRSPADSEAGNSGMDRDGYLFVCSAKARIKLPVKVMRRVADSALSKIPEGLDIQGDTIAPRVVYTTRAAEDKRLEVGMALENPLLTMTLDVLLRSAAQDRTP
jgi:hypothetical protein